MRKTLATLAILAGLALAGCGSNDKPEAAPASSFTESAAPSESVPTTVVDFRKDVSDVKAIKADPMAYPEGNALNLWFTLTNHGGDTSTYEVVFSLYDSTKAQIGSVLVNTENSRYAPVKPNGVLKVSGVYVADIVIPDVFTIAVQSVDRIPVTPEGN